VFALLNALLGALAGALLGGTIGALEGGITGALAGVPLAAILAVALGIPAIDEWLRNNPDADLDAAHGRLGDLVADAWDASNTKAVLDEIGRWLADFADESGLSRFAEYVTSLFDDLNRALAALAEDFLAGFFDPDNIVKGGIIGGLAGALLGAILGFLVGALD